MWISLGAIADYVKLRDFLTYGLRILKLKLQVADCGCGKFFSNVLRLYVDT